MRFGATQRGVRERTQFHRGCTQKREDMAIKEGRIKSRREKKGSNEGTYLQLRFYKGEGGAAVLVLPEASQVLAAQEGIPPPVHPGEQSLER